MTLLLGYRRDGRPILPMMGGADEPPDPPEDDPPAEPPEDDPTKTPEPPEPPKPSLEDEAKAAIEQLRAAGQEVPKALQKAVDELGKARKEAADASGKARATARAEAAEEARKQLAQEIGKALGLVGDDDDPPDPDALQTQIAASNDAARQSRIELGAYRTAGKHGADPDALVDSRTFLDSVSGLDPDADDFQAGLASAIKKALEANPTLKAAPGGRREPRQGPQGEPGGTRPRSIQEAVDRRLRSA